ncbi:MAG: rhodanese-like domain-containing protein [Caldilineae bacterium]|nr:MAG: rhodanese-like domain-containing protein [Caldilineae bacterium]
MLRRFDMFRRLFPLLLLLILTASLAACGGSNASAPAATEVDLGALPVDVQPADVAALLDNPNVVIVDVREPWEYDQGHIPGATLIPLGSIPQRMSEIPRDKTVVAVCRSGNRSAQATGYLREHGYDNVHNMLGGMLAWEQEGYRVER